jgi:hypothetical protein
MMKFEDNEYRCEIAALADDNEWQRATCFDKRFAHGDDFAGDAWRNAITGEIRYVAVGVVLERRCWALRDGDVIRIREWE